jgi:tRNA U34 5-methylaminomethyl-2-thiouridine-forming methyltransferase MnmC
MLYISMKAFMRRIFMSQNEKYRFIRTEDSTFTLYAKAYDEPMHSLSGAYEEALLKHVYPSRVLDLDPHPLGLHVLDVGFGLGYNILALIVEYSRRRYDGGLSIISFEKERSLSSIMDLVSFHDDRDIHYSLIKAAYSAGHADRGDVNIRMEFGDARGAVKRLSDIRFDAVFLDPFSPSKNPELWSVEFFKELYRLTGDAGIITTYSSASQVRAAIHEAGFNMGHGPSVGGKREGTIASKGPVAAPLSERELIEMRLNPRSVPYRDRTLSDDPHTIRTRRRDEIQKQKTAAC